MKIIFICNNNTLKAISSAMNVYRFRMCIVQLQVYCFVFGFSFSFNAHIIYAIAFNVLLSYEVLLLSTYNLK